MDRADVVEVAADVSEKRTFIVGNLLGVALGRVGGDLGTIVAPHVAPTASIHFQAVEGGGSNNAIAGLGGELGIRLYGGATRPSGPFVGVYALAGRYYASNTFLDFERASTIMSYGAAADVGWSFCTARNVVVAIGGGVSARGAQQEPHAPTPGTLVARSALGGIHPRALLQIGAFF